MNKPFFLLQFIEQFITYSVVIVHRYDFCAKRSPKGCTRADGLPVPMKQLKAEYQKRNQLKVQKFKVAIQTTEIRRTTEIPHEMIYLKYLICMNV